MEKRLTPGDPVLIENIVKYLKAKGIFDEFRHECLADVDTKSSCQNLSQRVDGYTTKFLSGEKWHPDLNKNELRNKLRRHIDESGMLAGGADHVVEQVINPKINQLFLPKIIEVVHQYLNEENEKLNKKKESTNENVTSEKPSVENIDGTNKTKATKLDPIADILSFSYSKPKSTPLQNVQTKVTDSTKTEKKKEEIVQQAKIPDVLVKTEKKKEELINTVKVSDAISKAKKDDTISDAIQNIEKEDESVSVKMEPVESLTDLSSTVPALQAKSQNDSKEPIKAKKEMKTEEFEASFDLAKKFQKEDLLKPDKKKGELEKKKDELEKKKDDFKPSSELSSHSEEGSQSKVVLSVPKSSNVVKSKSEAEKSKKVKPHSSSKTSSEIQKTKTKDSDKVSGKSSEKHKTSSKVSKLSSKDHSSPHKNSGTSKSSKTDKTEDSNKNKSKDGHSKPSDNSTSKHSSFKSSSIKKESSIIKSKFSSDKAKISKSSDMKPNIKTQSDSSEKTSRSSLQYSSYDSSQGSDQDKSSTSSSQHEVKHKHFSKHHKKESSNKKSSMRVEKTPDKKRFQSDSDSGTPIKHKHMKHTSEKEKKKSLKIQESAKISSRSNSFGSTSSVSDSPSSSSKEASASTSEETSDNSLKSSKAKKKQEMKDKEHCKRTDDFPPPPPPPPTSGISAPGSSSAEVSSMDETQSSQDSESDSKISEDESSSESDVENLYSSNTLKNSNLQSRLKTPEILNDVFDIFLYSSSSSEFEGYSSTPEQGQSNINVADVYVSSVHTSELSSFDDFLSESECSNSDVDEDRPMRRLTIKEAEKLLEEKARQRRLDRSKNVLALKGSLEDKKSNNSPQIFNAALLSEDESSPVPEPKRESRRERKLNPKYASSEYASIFNSKKTSFITKQASPYEDKSENVSPAASETDSQRQKDIPPPKRRISMGNLEANQLPDENKKKSSCAAATLQTFEFSDKAKRKLSFESPEESSWTSETKTYLNSHERNHNMILEDTDSHIALKIKKSVIRNDNAINKEPRPQGLKRKLTRNEKEDAKKLCRRNSDNSSSSESVPNENNPFNIKTNNPSSVFNMELKNKDFFHRQKINNNGVVLKMEHVKKKSHPKPNHVIEKQSND